MDIQKILNYLPHRYPFLLIDRVISFEPGQSLVALKNVTMNEPYFTGHFPERPVMPGVLILEAMAQASCVLANVSVPPQAQSEQDYREHLYLFAGIDDARFKRIVEPGDQLILTIKLLKHRQGVWKFSAVATVADEVVCTANMVSARKEINRD